FIKKMSDETTAQFCSVTGAPAKDAKRYLDKYKRLDAALDAYFNDPVSRRGGGSATAASTSKLNALFDKYKADPDGDEITIDGTIKFCEDLSVNPEDVVLLSVAYELKSNRMGEWGRQGWLEGWKNLGCDNTPAMRASLPKLSQKLSSDPNYFRKVYNHTFEFGRLEGQRSLAMDSAQAFWALLLPHGLKGGALSHTTSTDEDDVDMDATSEEGWKDQYTQWWFEYLEAKGGKGVSKDTWSMFLDFVRSIDAKFEKYDAEGDFTEAWPSTIDDFVEWARERLKSSA
ncbi:defective in Cullin neddylation protein 1, partial [Desarmillaria ectypa]